VDRVQLPILSEGTDYRFVAGLMLTLFEDFFISFFLFFAMISLWI
jgi:hypothetical protein